MQPSSTSRVHRGRLNASATFLAAAHVLVRAAVRLETSRFAEIVVGTAQLRDAFFIHVWAAPRKARRGRRTQRGEKKRCEQSLGRHQAGDGGHFSIGTSICGDERLIHERGREMRDEVGEMENGRAGWTSRWPVGYTRIKSRSECDLEGRSQTKCPGVAPAASFCHSAVGMRTDGVVGVGKVELEPTNGEGGTERKGQCELGFIWCVERTFGTEVRVRQYLFPKEPR